jgi:hypothetical protein
MMGGILFHVICFVVVAVVYEDDRNAVYISLNNDRGCSFVSKTLTGTYLASTQGLWEGQQAFQYTNALYSFQFSNATFAPGEYQQFIRNVSQSLTDLSNFTLAITLIYLMSAVYSFDVNNNTQYAQLTGAPSVIFDRLYIGPFVVMANSTPGGDYLNCSASYAQPQFWQSEATFHVEYNYNDYIKPTSNCNSVMNIQQFFGEVFPGQQTVTIDLDMISFSTAFAMNIGILNSDYLETVLPVGGEAVFLEFHGVRYTYIQNYDIRYPAMDPIGCIVNFNVVPAQLFFCLLELDSTFALPIINSGGNNYDSPEYCNW